METKKFLFIEDGTKSRLLCEIEPPLKKIAKTVLKNLIFSSYKVSF